mmetsp:Transcript_32181/g.78196  ORF Transcript_32181/g.78196 Transcript_32181/m.78196 type:complete len:151 (-) Transcript_32181:359-811(-)
MSAKTETTVFWGSCRPSIAKHDSPSRAGSSSVPKKAAKRSRSDNEGALWSQDHDNVFLKFAVCCLIGRGHLVSIYCWHPDQRHGSLKESSIILGTFLLYKGAPKPPILFPCLVVAVLHYCLEYPCRLRVAGELTSLAIDFVAAAGVLGQG